MYDTTLTTLSPSIEREDTTTNDKSMMYHRNSVTFRQLYAVLKDVGRKAGTMNVHYYIKDYEEMLLKLACKSRKKRGADVSTLHALLKEYKI